MEEEEEDENENLCVKCNKPGMLLCCDSCPGSYHLTCADPPLKKVPRGKWLCQVCLGVDKPGGKIKLVHKKKSKRHLQSILFCVVTTVLSNCSVVLVLLSKSECVPLILSFKAMDSQHFFHAK